MGAALMALLGLALLGGCGGGDAPGARVLEQVELGTLKGEVYRALGPGPVDSLQYQGRSEYGYPVTRFLVEGESVEVVWVPQEGYAPGDSIRWRESTPVLFRNIALLGWGWSRVEPLAEEMGIAFPGMASYRPPPGQGQGEDPSEGGSPGSEGSGTGGMGDAGA